MGKILTVSIAAYNCERYIENTLESFANQNYNDTLEVFIIDDGGTDKTLEISQKYADKYPEIFIPIHKANAGWGSTLNYGIRNASGKYFKQLDGDDKFLKENIAEFLKVLNNCNEDLIYTPFVFYDEIKKKITEIKKAGEDVPRNTTLVLEDYLSTLYIAMHNCTFKTEVLRNNKINITEKCFYTDIEFVLKGCVASQTVRVLDIPIYWYRISREGQSMSYSGIQKHYLEHQKVTYNLLEYFTNNIQNGEKRKFVESKLLYLIENQYSIYGIITPNKEHKKQLIEFNSIIKSKYPEYYRKSNPLSYIKVLRNTKFIGYYLAHRLRLIFHNMKNILYRRK
ncbi:MAG: glycosyltransferase family 2 protein [Eubacteriaceae bacterium]|uniref:Glycosyltransferase family 2 protein n=1 Tax=Candidatus Pseudoramibacter fermentans TaxID=2594427 RepID=A0A6L5GPN7_9FIRM|nr:glycosyltransferase family 2 protein [Candidatus Pseudoramibacter fermentans]RRF92434.1 MAG: glycosyltransferase family 2 protein [Eubacteriaceae bacterium]